MYRLGPLIGLDGEMHTSRDCYRSSSLEKLGPCTMTANRLDSGPVVSGPLPFCLSFFMEFEVGAHSS